MFWKAKKIVCIYMILQNNMRAVPNSHKIWRDLDGDGRINGKREVGNGKWEGRDCNQKFRLPTIDYSL